MLPAYLVWTPRALKMTCVKETVVVVICHVILSVAKNLFLYSYKLCGGQGYDFDGGEQVIDGE
jgi:hypothetical protein